MVSLKFALDWPLLPHSVGISPNVLGG